MDGQIQTAIIGFGLSGRCFHAPFIHTHPGLHLKTVVERHSGRAAETYPYVSVLKDYRELLRDDELELVVIATPNIYHYEHAKACLESGKHVVIEKPFTPTSREADQLIGLSEKTGRKIFVYQNRRWDGDFKTVQQVVYHGYLGELLDYEAHFDRFAPGPRRSAWRDEPLPAGGVLFDLGSHLIDQALVLFGLPNAVWADIRKLRAGRGVDDCFEVRLFYERLRVALKASVFVKEPGPRYILHGTTGSFLKYGIDPQEEWLKQGLMPDAEGFGADDEEFYGILNAEMNGQEFRGNVKTEAGNYMEFYDNVFDVLRKNGSQAVLPEEARNVIRIIELAIESAEKGTIAPLSR